ncbi:polarized growth protein Boi2 [Cucurbitaria berberidis CBS 394.84]|uniref:Polarized growth protein Boi2 n=1 Tax=Cucurbitaria berberidis CBS 394.84 TaxID=1168544 RepID=A0A9P4GT23_9PLEO|nr:polarized growth protein Boi2 [Cucurbitaria berberidis CBS 394.84]KAF1851282.1 polarized growth protein Boi2 [Cucurbitaria berberidis CBS 394.84]
MAQRSHTESCKPGDTLVVVHEFLARSPDELSLRRGDRIELIERDDDFGDGWFLGKNTETGDNGLFPEVYTRPAPQPTPIPTMLSRNPSQASTRLEPPPATPSTPTSETPSIQPLPAANTPPPLKSTPTEPLNIPTVTDSPRRTSLQAAPRSISMTLSGEVPQEDETIGSPVMHETLSVIDEHITDMSTPRHSTAGKDLRANDSGSEYSSHHRLSYMHGQETDDEEQNWHTEEEVKTWSPARVAEYLEDVGVEKKHCHVFRDQDIDGEALLGVDRNFIFMQEFDLGPMGPRLRTWMKINALQSEVKNAKEAARVMHAVPSLDGHDDFPPDPARNRAASTSAVLPRIPTLRESIGSRGTPSRQQLPRTQSSTGRSSISTFEATSPLIQHMATSPTLGSPSRPSAASVRNMNHNRRHSSIDYNQNTPTPGSPVPTILPPSHKKAPSFDRNWTMGATPKPLHDSMRPSSAQHTHSTSTNGTAFDARESGMTSPVELDRGYFSGGEVDSRKNRNVLRKRDSTGHSRNPSYSSDAGRRMSYSRRHSRIASADSMVGSTSTMSPAAKQYFGTGTKGDRSSTTFDFVRPLKPPADMNPTVTKLTYDSHSIDAIANSPNMPGSETSSTGRASPSPAAQTHSRSFFSKKSQSRGLRAISDAITGGEKANVSAGDVTASSNKDSPMQSPTRTGSSTPSGTEVSKSFDLEKPDMVKRLTGGSTATKDGAKKKSKKHGTSAYLKGRQQITPQDAMANCDYSGWMKKKSSSLMTTWKTRLFVLRGRRLSYYYAEDDTEEKGLIDISSHRVLPANNERMTGLHATFTRATSSPSSPQNATIQTAAATDSANGIPGIEEDVSGMFIFKLVPPRAGLQKGVQFTKPIVHYFAVDSLAVGRLWMAALMKATIDRDEALPFTTTYQQKTISLEKARVMRQRPPNLMDEDDTETGSADNEKKSEYSKESIQESVIHEEDEKGLAISGLDEAKAILAYADTNDSTTETKHESTTTATTSAT